MKKKNIFRLKYFTIDQTHASQKVGTDSDLLGTLAHGGERILDIGTGTGILTLMMAQRFTDAKLTAIEIDDDAVIDAATNFDASPWSNRITLLHTSFQDYLKQPETILKQSVAIETGEALETAIYDCIICNPPYFDRSLECPTLGRLRARHTSSLPFDVLISGSYDLLCENGVFNVCLPPEVLDGFVKIATETGFRLKEMNRIMSLPDNPPKRYILVFQKSQESCEPSIREFSMRNEDHTYSEWYKETLKDFLTGKIYLSQSLSPGFAT